MVEPEVVDAKQIAERKMDTPCDGDVDVRFERLRRDTLGVTMWSGMHPDTPPDERYDCKVILNKRRSWSWGILCTTIVHEFGHLAGRPHSNKPGSVMNHQFTRPWRGCMESKAAERWR